MGKYESLEKAIFSVFNSLDWKSENIKTVPDNYDTTNITDEFIRVSIIPSGGGFNHMSVSGIVKVGVFTKYGNGPRRASIVSDKLDAYLAGKSFTETLGLVQFAYSSFSPQGQDKDDYSLYYASYSIPFNFFGKI